jgi:predicted nuclease of restriction endonuclease-like (RecB) superfamily
MQNRGKIVEFSTKKMIEADRRGIAKPKFGELGQNFSFIGNKRGENMVKSRDPI